MEREIRTPSIKLETRMDDDTGDFLVEGYAAVFGERANIGDMFEEVIERGAFTDAIGRDDVVFLINHEGLPLARSRAGDGTLTLSQDERGLKITTRLDPNDPDVKNIQYKMKRGDLDKMSFAFYPDVQEWDESGDMPLRTIKRASLYDVSIVTTPAYNGTEIALRSLEASRAPVRGIENKRRKMEMKLRGMT